MRVTLVKKRKKLKTHGFLRRRKTSGGRAVLKRRRAKGRYKLSNTRHRAK